MINDPENKAMQEYLKKSKEALDKATAIHNANAHGAPIKNAEFPFSLDDADDVLDLLGHGSKSIASSSFTIDKGSDPIIVEYKYNEDKNIPPRKEQPPCQTDS